MAGIGAFKKKKGIHSKEAGRKEQEIKRQMLFLRQKEWSILVTKYWFLLNNNVQDRQRVGKTGSRSNFRRAGASEDLSLQL